MDALTRAITRFPLPGDVSNADLNTSVFDAFGRNWFTGQAGYFGSIDPGPGRVSAFPAPRGRGPYGIASSPDGYVYFVSLAGDFVGKIDPSSSRVTVLQPPRAGQGTRRIWADSKGILWITGWSSGNLIRLDPKSDDWRFFRLPGAGPSPYAVYVDEADSVWVSDWGSNSILRYDPGLSTFKAFPHSGPRAEVRQIMGRKGELWGAESRRDRIFVIRY